MYQLLTKILSREKQCEYHGLTTLIEDYEIVRQIGGIEEISYLLQTIHVPTGKQVCLKQTDMTLSSDYEFIEELITNIHNYKRLKHPHILPHFVSFIDGENLWATTIPLYGTAIHLMKSKYNNGLPEVAVSTIIKMVSQALVYLHEKHIIHNDIKADNIFIEPNGEVRLGGFRQLRLLQTNGQIHKSIFSTVGDNIEWAAPEVIVQNSNYTIEADIYSLGITALELMYNQTPFSEWPPLKVFLCKLNYECPAIPIEKKVSKQFFKFVKACVHNDPKQRPTIQACLEHPFLKHAKGASYLENLINNEHGSSESVSREKKEPELAI